MFPYLKVLLLIGLLAVILDNCLALRCQSYGGHCRVRWIDCKWVDVKYDCTRGYRCCRDKRKK